MNDIFLTKLQVVFFLQNPISVDSALDFALILKDKFKAGKIQINSTFSVPPGIPAPFPLLSAKLPDNWQITVNANRIDCVKNILQPGVDIAEEKYQLLERVYSELLTGFAINRMGSVAQFQDISKNAASKLKVHLLNKNFSDTNDIISIAFVKIREENEITFYDNFQIARETMLRPNLNIVQPERILKIVRDLNTGGYVNSFSPEILKEFFAVSKNLFSINSITEELYGNNN